jgi:predicted phage tail protein
MELTHLLAHLGTAIFAIVALTAAGIIFVTNVIRIDYETAGRRSFLASVIITALLLVPTYVAGDAATALHVDGLVSLGALVVFGGVFTYVAKRRNKG